MNLIFYLVILPVALLLAFVFAGFWSAFTAALMLTFGSVLLFRKHYNWLRIAVSNFVLTGVIYSALYFGGLLGANEDIKWKIQLIEAELNTQNYQPKWVIISQKRSPWLNGILEKSATKSKHLEGLAIDLYVMDINGDWIYDNKDVEILYATTLNVEKKYPNLKGGFGIYFCNTNSFFTRHMIHLDLRSEHFRFFR